MGRWTPLVLMAGGLAILLGTLIGSLYPMGPQTAQSPQGAPNRASSVLPANINVNSTNTGSGNRGAVAQNNAAPSNGGNTSITNGTNIDQNQSTTPSGSNSNSGNSPIKALW